MKGLCYIILLFLSLFAGNNICYSQDSTTQNYIVTDYYHCQLDIKRASGNILSLVYQTLPANQSGANRNTLWFWRSTQVPWKYPPAKKQVLPADATQSGSYVLDDISINIGTGYIACYSVDSNVKQVCACAHLAANSDSTSSEWIDIRLLNVAANSLAFSYTTLAGYLPATYGNWWGVWAGTASPYNSFPALGTGKPTDDASSNSGAINNIKLEGGQSYTLIYFTGKKLSNAATMITFTIK